MIRFLKNYCISNYINNIVNIAGFIYNRQDYYFDKNTLGDIIAIRDYHGTIIATYEYDAWGNHRVLDVNGFENTNSMFIGNINPFRYRGYYYDAETGFYYLQTRYYDPETCRFINADNYELISQLSSTYELNLYTYCGNNPIMRVDDTGEGWWADFWESVGNWFNDLGDKIDTFFRKIRWISDKFFESFYFNVGVGFGYGIGLDCIFAEIEFLSAVSIVFQVLPSPSLGKLEQYLFSTTLLGVNFAKGMDEFSNFGNGLKKEIDMRKQDITIGLGVSGYFIVGAFVNFGFNVSKFIRLIGA